MKGLITRSTGTWFQILPEDSSKTDGWITARLRGKFKNKTEASKLKHKPILLANPVVVGDWVNYTQDENGDYMIDEILARCNYIIRKSVNLSKRAQIIASNIDQAFLLITLKNPETPFLFVDRFLVACESFRIPVVLVFNKIDMYQEEELSILKHWKDIYEKIGYQTLSISAKKLEDVAQIADVLKDKTVVLSGLSGVGKSTLVNAIDPNFKQRVGEISAAFHKTGKHTTTYAQMFPLATGGYIIDTPGIRGFGFYDLEPKEISHYFPEMRALMNQCKYDDCTHTHEPKCMVIEAVEKGIISAERYDSYCSLLQEPEEHYRTAEYE